MTFEQVYQIDMDTAEPALDAAYFRSVDYYEGELLLGSSQSEIVTFNTDS